MGLGSEDDVVVNTEDSGLIPKAQPYEDHFDHWPQVPRSLPCLQLRLYYRF